MTRRVAPVVAVCLGVMLLIPAAAAWASQTYIVQDGDTLWTIAARFGISVDALISANQLANPDALKLGQRLVIPSKEPSRSGGAPPTPAGAAALTHVVQNGDTLWSIASRYEISVDAIVAANRLPNPDALKLGQRLMIPGRSVPQPVAPRPAQSAPAPNYIWHTVTAGETLWTLAARYRTTVNTLIALNGLQNPDALRLGQRLKVPGRAPAARPAPATQAAKPVVHAPTATTPAAQTTLRPVAPVRALPSTAVAPVRLLPRSAIPSRGEKWASALQQVAVRVLGVRYRWGGISPRGFDCSGFINYVLSNVGVRVPRTTFAMFKTGRLVSRSQLQVGDIVFFQTVSPGPSHAGIYVGNNLFMHSSSGIGRVSITSLDYRYYKARYLGARRF